MKTLSLSNLSLSALVEEIKNGATLVYPTETCYGLGADGTSDEAVKKLFALKKRDESKPMLVVFGSVEIAKEYVEWNPTLSLIAAKYWPGPLTVVVPVKENSPLSRLLIGKDSTLAFRISSHPFVSQVAEALQKPLVSTSANIAGGENPYSVGDVLKNFSQKNVQPDILIDGGTLPFTPPSTLITLENNMVRVLRQGSVQVDLS